jgi:hypothetical protein
MDPGQLPGDPEPGLVEVRDLSPDRALTTSSRDGAIISAIFLVIPASVARDGAQPNISAIVRQARSLDKNCPDHRYTPSAAARTSPGRSPPPGAAPGHRPATAPPTDHLVLGDLSFTGG